MDNVSIDSEGHVWAASKDSCAAFVHTPNIMVGFPNTIHLTTKHFNNPSIPSPSSAHRFSINTNPAEIMYGKKYKVEKASAPYCLLLTRTDFNNFFWMSE